MLKTALSGATVASVPSEAWEDQNAPIKRKGQIKQSVSRWCYKQIALDDLCAYAAQIGLKGIDLLNHFGQSVLFFADGIVGLHVIVFEHFFGIGNLTMSIL